MNSFADELVAKIKTQETFWADFDAVCSSAIRKILPALKGLEESELSPDIIGRIVRSAVIFSQSKDENDRGMAQDLALFAAVVSKDDGWRTVAKDVLTDLGNHPGASRLNDELAIPKGEFTSVLRTALLRAINHLDVGGKAYALTDFQRSVWMALPQLDAVAVSAPTSAGKSFVVLEYLCQEALRSESFLGVFIAPTRALLGEVHLKISERLKEHTEKIRISTIPTLDREQKPKQIFILTQERLHVLLSVWGGIFDLVIVDEAQAIGDQSRGMILQDCLEVINQRSQKTRFFFLSPGATNFDAFKQAVSVASLPVEDTNLSPVVQNRIVVEPVAGNDHQVDLSLLNGGRSIKIGTASAERGFGNAETRLAAVALELGSKGGSLIYGTGPADAESIAAQIASGLKKEDSEALKELSDFIKDHVHRKYSLASHVLKGVGFHYGKMPGLLRESLEEAFKSGDLKYLVCTTTLFQGVNLPARNVFIDTPTRGRGADLDPALLWNFAGRAGRLGQDIVGNVFLVGYGSWETQPLTNRVKFQINPAFSNTIYSHQSSVLARLRDEVSENEGDGIKALTESAAGLLISRAARKTLDSFLERTLAGPAFETSRAELGRAATEAQEKLGLPGEALFVNWTVNPFGQARLLKRFREKIKEGEIDDLIPVHPSNYSSTTYQRYVSIFSRLNREVNGKSSSVGFNRSLATVSLAWMRGSPLPVIIDKRIRYLEKEKGKEFGNVDGPVRKVFEFVEDVLRFRYVQLGKAYIDLLRFALNEAGLEVKAREIYDFPLALELGVSSVAGQAFIELGLSRIAASSLEGLIPDSSPTVETARQWLMGLTGTELPLSKVIWAELSRKGLMAEVA